MIEELINESVVQIIEFSEGLWYSIFFSYIVFLLAGLIGFYITGKSIVGALFFQIIAIGFFIIGLPILTGLLSV